MLKSYLPTQPVLLWSIDPLGELVNHNSSNGLVSLILLAIAPFRPFRQILQ